MQYKNLYFTVIAYFLKIVDALEIFKNYYLDSHNFFRKNFLYKTVTVLFTKISQQFKFCTSYSVTILYKKQVSFYPFSLCSGKESKGWPV